MTPGHPPTIGVDLGGTNIRAAIVDRDGTVIGEERASTPAHWPDLRATITRLVEQLRDEEPTAAAVGVGAAGIVDRDGAIHYAPNIPRLVRVPLREVLADVLPVPVIVDNDANVAAWGEVCHGAARGVSYGLVITLGTGVGGGIISDGRIYRGAHGFGGEVGHWPFDPDGPDCACGEPGHWEAVASGEALGALARDRVEIGEAPTLLARAGGDPAGVTGLAVGAAAAAGDAVALDLLATYAREVALGFAGLANILDPELIVVSGGLVQLGDLLLDPLRDAFESHLEGAPYRPEVPIVAAALGDRAGVVGAAALARDLDR
ncbi:MAG TPA: ROK family protein [Acidimicrobiia bacterium]|nr:ROK family protein [Acidimicrobiia bacterium]